MSSICPVHQRHASAISGRRGGPGAQVSFRKPAVSLANVISCWRDLCSQTRARRGRYRVIPACARSIGCADTDPFPRLARDRLVVASTLVIPWPALAQDATPATGGDDPIPDRDESRPNWLRISDTPRRRRQGVVYRFQYRRHPDRPSLPGGRSRLPWHRGSDLRSSSVVTSQRTPAPTGLADSWEIAPDGVTYTFHLNKDAKWHDGVDVTAADVQFSFDALANPDTGSDTPEPSSIRLNPGGP